MLTNDCILQIAPLQRDKVVPVIFWLLPGLRYCLQRYHGQSIDFLKFSFLFLLSTLIGFWLKRLWLKKDAHIFRENPMKPNQNWTDFMYIVMLQVKVRGVRVGGLGLGIFEI